MRSPCSPSWTGLATALLAVLGAGCDTTFAPVGGGSSQTTRPPLEVSGIEPASGRTEVGPQSSFRVLFGSPADPATLGEAPITLSDLATGEDLAGASALAADGRSLLFTPATAPLADKRYCLALSAAIKSDEGAGTLAAERPGGLEQAGTSVIASSSPSRSARGVVVRAPMEVVGGRRDSTGPPPAEAVEAER